MHSALKNEGTILQIDGVRVPEVGRCHVLLRQMDSRETAVDKHIVLDLATTADLQTMLAQVSHQRRRPVTGQLADTPTRGLPIRGLDISRTRQLAH